MCSKTERLCPFYSLKTRYFAEPRITRLPRKKTEKRKISLSTNQIHTHTLAVLELLTGGESSQLVPTNSTTDQCFAASSVSPLSSPPLPSDLISTCCQVCWQNFHRLHSATRPTQLSRAAHRLPGTWLDQTGLEPSHPNAWRSPRHRPEDQLPVSCLHSALVIV